MMPEETEDTRVAAGRELGVVLVTPGGLDPLSQTLAHLRRQTARERIELIVIGPGLEETTHADPAFEGLGATRILELATLTTTGAAFAAGVRAVSTPLVACAEEHSYPEPGWAEALIDAHSGPWVAVGGVLENANPVTSMSWSHLYSDFGPAVKPAPASEVGELPGHHTCYRRDVLLAYGDHLDRALEVEWVLQDDLRAKGGRLFCEPRAVSRHLNVSRLRSGLLAEFLGGRSFGANRAELRGWSPAHRLLYVLASPLLPAFRLTRALGDIRRSNPQVVVKALPTLVLSLIANTAGQALGYAFGLGSAPSRRIDIELRRHAHLADRDHALLPVQPTSSR